MTINFLFEHSRHVPEDLSLGVEIVIGLFVLLGIIGVACVVIHISR